jgi:threonine dehydrogenase-like Zn-dependent dehydrogenase
MSGATVRGLGLRLGASAFNQRALRIMGTAVPRLTGRLPWLALGRRPAPALPGPDWARVRPLLAGICGSDLSLITGRASATLSPFASFPAVLGHEVVGVIEEAGGRVTLPVGARVAIDPVISCAVRGLDPCASCSQGLPALCLHAADGDLSPGMLIGYCRDLPGGWSDGMLVHASQLHPVPDELPDDVAVLLEPLSICLHAVLADPPRDGERILIIGGGSIGLGTLAALRLTGVRDDVTVTVRHPFQAALAERLGATRTVADDGGRGARRAAVEAAGARSFRPLAGDPVLSGGFDRVYDCVGSRASLGSAMRVSGPRGRIVLIGGAFEIADLDWTLVWTRELRITGSYGYGREASVPGEPHTFDHLLRLLAEHPELPMADLVTHRFSLDRWPEALNTALGRGGRSAVKVVFDHRSAYPAEHA